MTYCLLCSETSVSDMRHVSELLDPGFGPPVLLCLGNMPWARVIATYVRGGYGAFRQPTLKCGDCELLVFRMCGVRQNLYVFNLYRNLDLDVACPTHARDGALYLLMTDVPDLVRVVVVTPIGNSDHSSLSAVI